MSLLHALGVLMLVITFVNLLLAAFWFIQEVISAIESRRIPKDSNWIWRCNHCHYSVRPGDVSADGANARFLIAAHEMSHDNG